jgi:hypothetical protein
MAGRDAEVALLAERIYAPALFSCSVMSFQSIFMRSLRDIQRSACSCGGISSQRFSMLASVGFEMACAWRVCCSWQAMGAARGNAARVAVAGMTAAELLEARRSDERSMVADGVESVEKWREREEASRRGTCGLPMDRVGGCQVRLMWWCDGERAMRVCQAFRPQSYWLLRRRSSTATRYLRQHPHRTYCR